MKKIELPVSTTLSFKLNLSDEVGSGVLMSDGKRHISIGSIGDKDWEYLNIAKENGAKILWSTVYLEKVIEDIILAYFMGPFDGPDARRELFKNELLQASFLQLSSKKHLVSEISKNFYAFKGKKRDKLQGYLKKIIQWRNAFAHGSLSISATDGILLTYYSGSSKTEKLNNGFWNTVESVFKSCEELLKSLEQIIKHEKSFN